MIENQLRDVCISLAGKAVLEQKFGITDIGVSSDLDMAFDSVKGLMGRCCTSGFSFYSEGYEDSEERKTKLEQAEVIEIERLYRKTKEILAKNNDLLTGIAKALAKKCFLTEADLNKIKEGCRVVPVCI